MLAAALSMLGSVPLLGNDTNPSILHVPSPEKDFAAYLPPLPAQAPWLRLDARTKLPKGDFPIGRDAGSIGRLAFPSSAPTQLSIRQDVDSEGSL
jgi:hypothetical protein